MDQDAAPVRPTASPLLRELDLQLAAAADALDRAEPALDLARSSVGRAQAALAELRAEPTGSASDEPDGALALVRRTALPPDRTSPRRARAFATQTCQRWALPAPVCNAAVDIASELVANAAAHGSGAVVLGLERGAGHLLVRVWDDGPGSPRVLPYRPGLSETGLGLRLVKQLSTHWGTAAEDGGKWVWARIELSGADD